MRAEDQNSVPRNSVILNYFRKIDDLTEENILDPKNSELFQRKSGLQQR